MCELSGHKPDYQALSLACLCHILCYNLAFLVFFKQCYNENTALILESIKIYEDTPIHDYAFKKYAK